MACRKLMYFMSVELILFIAFACLSIYIGDEIWNIRALHFIIFQDWLFIIFSVLPALGNILSNERISIFIFHCCVIGTHTLNGISLVLTGREKIDPQFFVSVACLVFIGCIFSTCVAIMLLIAYCSGDFESIFDEQFLNIDSSQYRSNNRRLNVNFLEDFEQINTLIFKDYFVLHEKIWPICLSEYEEGDVLKILPQWYHTFHSECIKNWFMNQLKWPFCRIDITREQIAAEKDMTEEELISHIKSTEVENKSSNTLDIFTF